MKGNISRFCNAIKDDARHFKLRSFPNGLGGYWKCLSGTGTNCRFPLIRQIGSMEYCISIKGLVITSKAVLLFLAINLKRGCHHCKNPQNCLLETKNNDPASLIIVSNSN